jgi:integrative and conjugative element protein (TIGR02256 family)
MTARNQMVSLTDWYHERRGRVWRPPADESRMLDELLRARRAQERRKPSSDGASAGSRAETKRKDGAGFPRTAPAERKPPEPSRVELSPPARSALAAVLQETADGTETGGCLIGHVDGETVVVEDVGGPGAYADRSSGWLLIGSEHLYELEDAYIRNGWAGRVIGDWHTHPVSGATKPSDTDREGWRNQADKRGVWVGLILTPGPDPDWPWLDPHVRGWVTSNSLSRSVPVANVGYAWER